MSSVSKKITKTAKSLNRLQLIKATITAAYKDDFDQAVEYYQLLSEEDGDYVHKIMRNIDDVMRKHFQLYTIRLERALLVERHAHYASKSLAINFEQMLALLANSDFLPEPFKQKTLNVVKKPVSEKSFAQTKQLLARCDDLVKSVEEKEPIISEQIQEIIRAKKRCEGYETCQPLIAQFEQECNFNYLMKVYGFTD